MIVPLSADRRVSRLAFLIFLVGFSCSAAGVASAGEARASLSDLALSARLAERARADRDPLAMIVAATIRRGVPSTPVERVPETSGAVEGSAGPATETTVEGLLTEAIGLSKNDPTIVALAEDVRAAAGKGLVLGAGASRATLPATGTDWYRRLRFEGSRYAEAMVELSGTGDVRVSVWDQSGNLVCRDPNPSSVAYCGWVPSRTAFFDIKVENRSTRPVPYRMYTN